MCHLQIQGTTLGSLQGPEADAAKRPEIDMLGRGGKAPSAAAAASQAIPPPTTAGVQPAAPAAAAASLPPRSPKKASSSRHLTRIRVNRLS
jgi:hypothetical protein